MKLCTRCGLHKPPDGFYASQPRSNTCIECARADQRRRNRLIVQTRTQNREFAKAAVEGRIGEC